MIIQEGGKTLLAMITACCANQTNLTHENICIGSKKKLQQVPHITWSKPEVAMLAVLLVDATPVAGNVTLCHEAGPRRPILTWKESLLALMGLRKTLIHPPRCAHSSVAHTL